MNKIHPNVKEQVTDWDKMFAVHINNNELVSKVLKRKGEKWNPRFV